MSMLVDTKTTKHLVILRIGIDMMKIQQTVYVILEKDDDMIARVVGVFWSETDAMIALNQSPEGTSGRWCVKESIV